mgnify:CR=1 FL=1
MNKGIKHLLAFVMAVLLVITAIPIGISTNAKAATNGHTQADAVAWAISQTNNPRDYDGFAGVQCVDLIRMYYVYLGYYQVQGSGCDYATNTIPCSTWKRISYYSGFIPQPGDVAVWTYASSSSGHVAIVTNADSSGFTVAEFLGSTHTGRTHRYSYSYGTLACFIRPDFNTVVDTTAPTISKTSVSCKTESQFNINAELYDENGIDHVWLVVYGPNGESQFSVNASNGSFYYTIYASEYGGQGIYTVHLYAIDPSGNSSKYVYENIKVMKDTTAPQITEAFVSCISANSFNINATIYDEEGIDHAWLVIYGPGGEYQYSASASNGFFYHTIFTSNHGGPGNYTVHLYIFDKSGNSSKAVYKNIMAANTYTVSYNVNGGTGSIASQTKTQDTDLTLSSTKPTGKSFTVTYNANGGNASASNKLVKQTFTSWNTAANGSGKTYNAGAKYSANESVTLYAQYANPSIGSLPTPTRSGYSFEGWYTSATGGTKITDSTKVTANITIYAHWTKNSETKAVVKDVKINHNVTVNYKSTYMLSPEITADKGAKYTVKYESSDTKVATVDKDGKIYGAKKGSATITCTVTDSYGNAVTDKCNVNVGYSGVQWVIIILLFGWIWYI